MVQALVERGADPTVRTEFGMSAVEMANSFDRKVTTGVLFHHKCDSFFDWSRIVTDYELLKVGRGDCFNKNSNNSNNSRFLYSALYT